MASSLDAHLESECGEDPLKRQVGDTIRHLAGAAIKLADKIAAGGDGMGQAQGATNAGGDVQKELDVIADKVFMEAAEASPLAFFGSEEQDDAVALKPDANLAMAIDPLDGSSNIETNVSIGTIFSILPVEDEHRADPSRVFRQKGSRQLGAGFFIYGPQLLLVMSMGNGTHTFIHAPGRGEFIALKMSMTMGEKAGEFAINASNYRHWDQPIRSYIDDLLAGSEGPRERDFNMRWVGSMVADCYRILLRGGVFLYPGDGRKGYAKGRLRLVYEANPIALCVENAGGGATDGTTRILDIEPEGLHDRTPLVFGSAREVERVARYIADPSALAERSPLFGKRSLFRT
ncbi:class 1 fructose-bisphosphatase [Jiella mangrovi]|uniref:Fructose-1,6-bisphosphatase class 1 n=1 Tax=Jiella mangrovi TaxID=2821407 RepID=A0ABS4BDK1_9HYPH|nr:class 1 fructose-bisphosphatase [Jiella mangrovi]MBP0614830.1 class 1 fructose-bisphosphatase [Jiella mangrovi]